MGAVKAALNTDKDIFVSYKIQRSLLQEAATAAQNRPPAGSTLSCTQVIKVGTSSLVRPEQQTLNLTNLARITETVKLLKSEGRSSAVAVVGGRHAAACDGCMGHAGEPGSNGIRARCMCAHHARQQQCESAACGAVSDHAALGPHAQVLTT